MIRGVLASEWIKICSVRSTYYTLGAILLVIVLAAFLTWRGVQSWEHMSPEQRMRFRVPHMELMVLPFVQFCVALLGVLAITAEYGSNTILTSLVSVPNRLVFLVGKAIIVAMIALVVGVIVPVATHWLSAMIVGDRLVLSGSSTFSDGRFFLGWGLSSAALAIVGFGLGAALRSTAGALITVTVLLFIPQTLAGYLQQPWNSWMDSVALANLATQLAHAPTATNLFSPTGTLMAMATYVLVTFSAGVVSIGRDV